MTNIKSIASILELLVTASCPVRGAGYAESTVDPNSDEFGHLDDDSFYSYQPGDIAIFLDYEDDDLDDEETELLRDWYNDEVVQILSEAVDHLGYKFIHELDGSGNGLYYGRLIYRKK